MIGYSSSTATGVIGEGSVGELMGCERFRIILALETGVRMLRAPGVVGPLDWTFVSIRGISR
jgi:hypothetical protein